MNLQELEQLEKEEGYDPKEAVEKSGQSGSERVIIQDVISFVEKHKASLELEDDSLKPYLDKEQLTNIDSLPTNIRNFIEQQNSVAGRDLGRAGYTFHTIDSEATFGPETHRQRLKREGLERWWRNFLNILAQYTSLYNDTYKMYRTALLAIKEARKDIKQKIQEAAAALKEINNNQQKFGKDHQSEKTRKSLRDSETRLKEELEDINMFEREVLVPVGKQLEDEAPDETELQRIQRKIRLVMPGRAFRFFLGLMNTLRPQFDNFPPLNRIYKPLASTPVPNLLPDKMEINIKPGQTGKKLYEGRDPEDEDDEEDDDNDDDFDFEEVDSETDEPSDEDKANNNLD